MLTSLRMVRLGMLGSGAFGWVYRAEVLEGTHAGMRVIVKRAKDGAGLPASHGAGFVVCLYENMMVYHADIDGGHAAVFRDNAVVSAPTGLKLILCVVAQLTTTTRTT